MVMCSACWHLKFTSATHTHTHTHTRKHTRTQTHARELVVSLISSYQGVPSSSRTNYAETFHGAKLMCIPSPHHINSGDCNSELIRNVITTQHHCLQDTRLRCQSYHHPPPPSPFSFSLFFFLYCAGSNACNYWGSRNVHASIKHADYLLLVLIFYEVVCLLVRLLILHKAMPWFI